MKAAAVPPMQGAHVNGVGSKKQSKSSDAALRARFGSLSRAIGVVALRDPPRSPMTALAPRGVASTRWAANAMAYIYSGSERS
jgi:hypothetical protein